MGRGGARVAGRMSKRCLICVTLTSNSFQPPSIRLDLANRQKTDNREYRNLISAIIAEYPDHIVCYTDGS